MKRKERRKSARIWLVALLMAGACQLGWAATTTERLNEPDAGGSHSVAPIAGYNPTYKVFLGAGYFYQTPRLLMSAVGVFTFNNVYMLQLRARPKWGDGTWSLDLNPEYSRGFDPYYGEGGATRVEDRVKLFGDRVLFRPTLRWAVAEHVSVGVFADVRGRREFSIEGRPGARAQPDELTTGLGLLATVDFRDNEDSPTRGYLFETRVTHSPTRLTSLSTARPFTQLEGTFKVFQELIPQTGFVAGIALRGGYSFGEPTYLFRYRLGGSSTLRGYHENRYRGKKFYLQESELRVPVFRFLETATFLGFGDATDDVFSQPKLIYGVGLRFGLPPDFVQKVRLDIGWGRDEFGVFLDFGHAF